MPTKKIYMDQVLTALTNATQRHTQPAETSLTQAQESALAVLKASIHYDSHSADNRYHGSLDTDPYAITEDSLKSALQKAENVAAKSNEAKDPLFQAILHDVRADFGIA